MAMLQKTDICVYYEYHTDISAWVRFPWEIYDQERKQAAFLLVCEHFEEPQGYHCEPLVEFPDQELVYEYFVCKIIVWKKRKFLKI